MDKITEFLNGSTNAQNIILLSFILTAFLLGLFLAWAVENAAIRKLENALKKQTDHLQRLEAENQQQQEALAGQHADLKRAQFEREEALAAQKITAQERLQEHAELREVQRELEKTLAANRQFLNTIEDLNDQILGLKTRLSQSTPGTAAPNPIQSRIAELENRIQRLETTEPATPSHTSPTTQPIVEPEFVLPRPAPLEPSYINRNSVQDDLTAIDGIGPFLERKLNEAGVFTYAQISNWSAADIVDITQKIQFFPGRIEKDDWVGKATQLLNASGDRSIPSEPLLEDDLKLINGISPEVEIILKKAGISTFDILAKTDPEEMETILQIANPKLAFSLSDTWPAQASMALRKEWNELQAFQDTLQSTRSELNQEPG